MTTQNLTHTYDQILKAKEELAAIKASENISMKSYETIDRLLALALVDINVKKLHSQD